MTGLRVLGQTVHKMRPGRQPGVQKVTVVRQKDGFRLPPESNRRQEFPAGGPITLVCDWLDVIESTLRNGLLRSIWLSELPIRE